MSLRDREKSSCYEKVEGIPALRVERDNGEIYVFPYIHFQFAQSELENGKMTLKLQFSTHHIQVCGSGLQMLLRALQKAELASISQSVLDKAQNSGCQIESILVQSLDSELPDENGSERSTS